MMEWDETDVLECLEVAPEITESDVCGPSYSYRIVKNGIHLELSVSPLEGDISILLKKSGLENPILEYVLLDCERIKRIKKESANEQLELKGPRDIYIRVSVQPNISVKVTSDAL